MTCSKAIRIRVAGLVVTLALIIFLFFSMFMASVSMLSGVDRDDLAFSSLWIPALPKDIIDRVSLLSQQQQQSRNEETVAVWQRNNPFFRNVTRDTFCHGCRVNEKVKACALQKSLLKSKNVANLSAITPKDLNDKCQNCLDCPERDHWYGRFDEAAPPVRQSVSHFLPSIPGVHRLPRNTSSWLKYFRQDPAHRYPNRTYFVEYNPSIVRIPTHQIPKALRDEGIIYLASFRVTNFHSCHKNREVYRAMMGYDDIAEGSSGEMSTRREYRDLLGLALLREDLSIVSDAVFKLSKSRYKIQDSRLFNLGDKLYWSSGRELNQFWLVDKPVSQGLEKLNPRFANNRDRPWTASLTIDSRSICVVSGDPGKNLQFFMDAINGTVVAELFPAGRKVVLDVNTFCPKSILGVLPVDNTVRRRSFGTIDEVRLFSNKVGSQYVCFPISEAQLDHK